MLPQRWLQILHRSGWEFWLPLPLIAAFIWVVGNQIVNRVLVQPHEAIETLEATASDPATTIWAINAQIDRRRNTTRVSVRTIDTNLRTIEYEFPTSEVSEIEQKIAQELEIEVEAVRRLASYRIQN